MGLPAQLSVNIRAQGLVDQGLVDVQILAMPAQKTMAATHVIPIMVYEDQL